MLVKLQHKIVVVTLLGGLLTTIVLLVNDPSYQTPLAASPETVYRFESDVDMEFTSDQGITPNLVYQDKNSTQAFTFNVGSFDFDNTPGVHVSWLGSNQYASLTGTSPGQFVVGNPTLQSLANGTNLINTKYLYGVRTHQDVILTNHNAITVTWGWDAGGDASGGYSAFLAYSTGGSSEVWTVLGTVQNSIDPTLAQTLSFIDSDNTKLMGQAVRFAFIMGASKAKPVLKNMYLTIQGTLRTTLLNLSNARFNHSGNYEVNETIALSDVLFDANYAYRVGGNTVALNGTSSGVTLTDDQDQTLPNPWLYASSGNQAIKISYTDPDPNQFGTATTILYFFINPMDAVMSGIYARDENNLTNTYYVYEFFNPDIKIYPLYNDASTPGEYDIPLADMFYTCTTVSPKQPGDVIKTGFSLAYEYDEDPSFTSTLTYTVTSRNLRSIDSIQLTHLFITFELGDSFSLGALLVTSYWDEGPNTVIPFAATQTDGKYTSSTAVGSTLDACGSFTNTITYRANDTDYSESYAYTVEYVVVSMFQHYFSDLTTVLGATTSVQTANFNAVEYTIDNAVSGGDDVAYLYTKYSADPNGDAASYQLTEDGLVLGTNGVGPDYVTLETKDVAAFSINSVHYSGILKLRIDIATDAVTELSVSVAGILASHYQRDSGEKVYTSIAITPDDGLHHSYIFYLPYICIGKVRFHITNHSTPEPFTLGLIAFAGYDLTLECRAKAFAQMLNHESSCEESIYQNFLPTYTYLVSVNAEEDLSTFIMTNHDETETLTAENLWNIMEGRYGVNGLGRIQPQQNEPIKTMLGLSLFMFLLLAWIGMKMNRDGLI